MGEAEKIPRPRLQCAKPLTIDFGRDPREPFSTPVEGFTHAVVRTMAAIIIWKFIIQHFYSIDRRLYRPY